MIDWFKDLKLWVQIVVVLSTIALVVLVAVAFASEEYAYLLSIIAYGILLFILDYIPKKDDSY
jgi:hypothetical protein